MVFVYFFNGIRQNCSTYFCLSVFLPPAFCHGPTPMSVWSTVRVSISVLNAVSSFRLDYVTETVGTVDLGLPREFPNVIRSTNESSPECGSPLDFDRYTACEYKWPLFKKKLEPSRKKKKLSVRQKIKHVFCEKHYPVCVVAGQLGVPPTTETTIPHKSYPENSDFKKPFGYIPEPKFSKTYSLLHQNVSTECDQKNFGSKFPLTALHSTVV